MGRLVLISNVYGDDKSIVPTLREELERKGISVSIEDVRGDEEVYKALYVPPSKAKSVDEHVGVIINEQRRMYTGRCSFADAGR